MMIIEISLAIIALAVVIAAVVFVALLFRIRKAVNSIQTSLYHLSLDTENLITNANDLVTDIADKSQSLNFLFRPFNFFNKKIEADTPSKESLTKSDTIPQIMGWIITSLILFKKSKEFIKNYGK